MGYIVQVWPTADLRKADTRATFYVIETEEDDFDGVLDALSEDGQIVGSRLFHHPHPSLPGWRVIRDRRRILMDRDAVLRVDDPTWRFMEADGLDALAEGDR